ncbi:MAG: RNA polymerase sigma factor [Polaribacter sp.]|uniref:RNA polymerase sigma factor n=1 Tax=Polaribacter sp. TaxID=1920175 RepID=UPI002F3592FB
MNKNKILSDAILIERYQKGDKKMISFLIKKWHLQFCNFAFWIVKDADLAKDIAQESWTIIINKLDNLKEPEKFKSWAISIVNRKAIDFLRAKQREQNKLQSLYFDSKTENIALEVNDNSVLKQKLASAIRKLSIEQQMVVKLFYIENYTLKEISKILKISIGTTKSRLFHAREKLKTKLKHINYEK